MTPTEQQNQALATFVALVVEKLNPTLQATTVPVDGGATYDVVIGGAVLHEQIETVLRIAGEHGGRAFIHHADERCGNCLTLVGTGAGCLSIVWRTP